MKFSGITLISASGSLPGFNDQKKIKMSIFSPQWFFWRSFPFFQILKFPDFRYRFFHDISLIPDTAFDLQPVV